jgi:uncharacterized membrane protein
MILETLTHPFHLFLGTIIYRPYVYLFFLCFLAFSVHHLRAKGSLVYTILAYLIAFASEYSSTRNGFPFGDYIYFDQTRDRELWVSNVPFWDSLSFVFLSYFSWLVAGTLRYKLPLRAALLAPSTALLSGLLMMLLDIVIDPLTLLGDQWFLGKIYIYPQEGPYFGVTLSNFAGWFFVGSMIPLAYQQLAKMPALHFSTWRMPSSLQLKGIIGVYSGIFVFNLLITLWIQQWTLMFFSSLVASTTLLTCYIRLQKRLGI